MVHEHMRLLVFLLAGAGLLCLFFACWGISIARKWPAAISSVLMVCILALAGVCWWYPKNYSPRGARYASANIAWMLNLQQVAAQLLLVAEDSTGAFSVSFAEFASSTGLEPYMFICDMPPEYSGLGFASLDEWTDYTYVSGLTTADPTNAVLLFSQPINHGGKKGAVVYVNGRSAWIDTDLFSELVSQPALFFGTSSPALVENLASRAVIQGRREARLELMLSTLQPIP